MTAYRNLSGWHRRNSSWSPRDCRSRHAAEGNSALISLRISSGCHPPALRGLYKNTSHVGLLLLLIRSVCENRLSPVENDFSDWGHPSVLPSIFATQLNIHKVLIFPLGDQSRSSETPGYVSTFRDLVIRMVPMVSLLTFQSASVARSMWFARTVLWKSQHD
jgi:hypothetical protein